MYGSFFRSQFRSKSALRKVFPAAEDFLIYLSEATVMSHAERDGVISMRRVRYTCSSVHDIENSEEETLKQ